MPLSNKVQQHIINSCKSDKCEFKTELITSSPEAHQPSPLSSLWLFLEFPAFFLQLSVHVVLSDFQKLSDPLLIWDKATHFPDQVPDQHMVVGSLLYATSKK